LQKEAAILAYKEIVKFLNKGLLTKIKDLELRCSEKDKMIINIQDQRKIFKAEFIPDLMGTFSKVG
jgi:hypothetical protein